MLCENKTNWCTTTARTLQKKKRTSHSMGMVISKLSMYLRQHVLYILVVLNLYANTKSVQPRLFVFQSNQKLCYAETYMRKNSDCTQVDLQQLIERQPKALYIYLLLFISLYVQWLEVGELVYSLDHQSLIHHSIQYVIIILNKHSQSNLLLNEQIRI